jgi:hypothetical protein
MVVHGELQLGASVSDGVDREIAAVKVCLLRVG